MIEKQSAGENPFCTRSVRPGAVEYCFLEGSTVEDLIDRLRGNQ
jgi:hypothetical protein